MSDVVKKAKNLAKKAAEGLDMNKVKKDVQRAGEMVKDGKITTKEKEEFAKMAKEFKKDLDSLRKGV